MTIPRSRPEPLSDEEIEELEDRLQHSYGEVSSFSELDGFFTAMLCGPEYILPTQYFPLILGSDNPNPAEYMPPPEYHAETSRLMLRHWHDLSGRLARGEFQSLPLPLDTDELAGEWWSRGFLLLAQYYPPDEWEEYFQEREAEGLFAPMEEMVRESERKPEERVLTGERRKELHQAVIDSVNTLYRMAAQARGQR